MLKPTYLFTFLLTFIYIVSVQVITADYYDKHTWSEQEYRLFIKMCDLYRLPKYTADFKVGNHKVSFHFFNPNVQQFLVYESKHAKKHIDRYYFKYWNSPQQIDIARLLLVKDDLYKPMKRFAILRKLIDAYGENNKKEFFTTMKDVIYGSPELLEAYKYEILAFIGLLLYGKQNSINRENIFNELAPLLVQGFNIMPSSDPSETLKAVDQKLRECPNNYLLALFYFSCHYNALYNQPTATSVINYHYLPFCNYVNDDNIALATSFINESRSYGHFPELEKFMLLSLERIRAYSFHYNLNLFKALIKKDVKLAMSKLYEFLLSDSGMMIRVYVDGHYKKDIFSDNASELLVK